jgi:preprotein translocase subunit SecD
VLYSLAQYRALGFVTVFSLVIAGVITYGLVVLLGWRQGYRLSLAGVTGLIVAIGITADSFIVYFERVRDEVRDGRGLQTAVENAWVRARRTILISDAVSFLAAVVLYVLAIGGVRGFAFTLGLTVVVDVLVVFLFTHPTVVMLSRTRFFGGGHKLSGFDAEHLGRAVAYTGRARVQPSRGKARAGAPTAAATAAAAAPSGTAAAGTGSTIAERRAAALRAEREALLGEPGAGGGADDAPSSPAVDEKAGAGETAGTSRRDA